MGWEWDGKAVTQTPQVRYANRLFRPISRTLIRTHISLTDTCHILRSQKRIVSMREERQSHRCCCCCCCCAVFCLKDWHSLRHKLINHRNHIYFSVIKEQQKHQSLNSHRHIVLVLLLIQVEINNQR